MNPEDFARLAGRTRMKQKAKEAARLILVEGYTPTKAAAAVAGDKGFSAPAAARAADRIARELRRETGCPSWWHRVCVIVPPRTAELIKNAELLERKRIGLK